MLRSALVALLAFLVVPLASAGSVQAVAGAVEGQAASTVGQAQAIVAGPLPDGLQGAVDDPAEFAQGAAEPVFESMFDEGHGVPVQVPALRAGTPPTQTSPGSTVFGSGGASYGVYPAPSSLPNSNGAGEPSTGVDWVTGAAFFQAYASTYKLVFDSSSPPLVTWSDVTSPYSVINIDPILFTDSSVGTTYAGGLGPQCSALSSTTNDGGSWSQMGNACAGSDHESIAAGPWHGSKPLLATANRVVYYCGQNGAQSCATSQNGGTTFGAPVTVSGACNSFHGHIKVSKDGTAYLPGAFCGAHQGGATSTDNGASWVSYSIAQSTAPDGGFDPSVATTPDNTVYEAYADGGSWHPMVARSTNHGASWDRVTDLASTVSPPIVASTFQAAVAGDNGRVAIAFLGTQVGAGTAPRPFDNGFHGVWNLFVSTSYDGGLSWSTVQVTSDPVQRGCLWDGGGSNSCRNLLDFMDASLTKDGHVLVGFADGCINACAGASGTEAQSTSAYATVARQIGGKGLFAAYDTSGPTAPGAPTLSASAGNAQVSLSWTVPADGGSAITGYKVYRGGALLATLGVTTTYTDSGLANGQAYSYQVSALNSVGEGAKSNTATATPTAGNQAPTACFTHSESGLQTSVGGACSTDPDGTIASYAWSWGDGAPAGSGASASHTYAAAGTYTVGLTVTDNGGATGTTSQSVTVTAPGDPDPSTPNLSNGVSQNVAIASGGDKFYKIQVPAGSSQLQVVMSGPSCGVLSCSVDADLYTRFNAKPTDSTYDCRPFTSGNAETCTHASPAAGWWYVRVHGYSGSGTVTIKATIT